MRRILVIVLLLMRVLAGHPAFAEDTGNLPECAPNDLDIAAQMGDGAHPRQTLTFDFRNKNSHPCVLRDMRMSPETGRHSGLCGPGANRAGCSTPASYTLQPGKMVHIVFAWDTLKAGENGQCSDVSRLSAYMSNASAGRNGNDQDDAFDDTPVAGAELFYSLHIGETTNFRIRLCSVPVASPYLDGPSGIVPAAANAEPDMHIALSKDYDTYYLDDPVKLHLDIDHPSLGLSSGLEGDLIQDMCWQMIVMQQTKKADGTLREELGNMANNPAYPLTCGLAPDGCLKMEKEIYEGFDEDNPPPLPDETVSYSIVRGENRLWRDIAATSNSLVIHHADPATLPHPWGQQADGFAVSLTLDKDRFDMGTAFRAHLACTRFGKDWKQKGYVEKVDPLCSIDTVLTDSNGNPVTKRFDQWEPELGNGSDKKVDRSFKAGQTLYREQILSPGGSFVYGNTPMPKLVPGTYYLTAFWDAEDDSISPPLRTVAKSLPVKIEISGGR